MNVSSSNVHFVVSPEILPTDNSPTEIRVSKFAYLVQDLSPEQHTARRHFYVMEIRLKTTKTTTNTAPARYSTRTVPPPRNRPRARAGCATAWCHQGVTVDCLCQQVPVGGLATTGSSVAELRHALCEHQTEAMGDSATESGPTQRTVCTGSRAGT